MKTRSSSIGLNAERDDCTTTASTTASTTAKVGNFNTTFSLPSFLNRVEKLSENQKLAIEKTGFGNLLKIPRYKLSKNLLVELMDKWCPEKRAFLLFPRSSNNSTLTINLMDIALVLGLRVVGNPVILREDERFIELEHEYGAALWNRTISISSIEKRLDAIGEAVNEDFIRSFLLFIFGTLLFPSPNSKIDSRYLYLLRDLDKVCDFSWGAAVLADVTNRLCIRKQTNMQFVGGCLIFLQIWCYEHIDMERPSLVNLPIIFPRACRWNNSMPRRQWVSTKFKELDKDQVIYKLQPTLEESNIDIVKELSEAHADGEVLPAEKANSEIDKVDKCRTRLRQNRLRCQIEPPSPSVTRSEYVDLCTPDIGPRISSPLELSENMDLCTPCEESEGQSGHVTPQLSASQDNSLSVIMICDDDDEDENIGTIEEFSQGETMQQKNETDDLREEINRLKAQLEDQNAELRNLRDENKRLKDQLQERNAELDDLRQENLLISSSSNDLVTRLERIVLNAYDEDEKANEEQSEQSHANG